MDFPEELLRGIPNKDFVEKDGHPTSNLFYFEKRDNNVRQDGFIEESINWYDDPKALEVLIQQKKENDKFQFQYGAVILLKSELDRLISKPTVGDTLSYERRKLDGNDYHGNLLLHQSVDKPKMKRIAASIATICIKDVVKFDR